MLRKLSQVLASPHAQIDQRSKMPDCFMQYFPQFEKYIAKTETISF